MNDQLSSNATLRDQLTLALENGKVLDLTDYPMVAMPADLIRKALLGGLTDRPDVQGIRLKGVRLEDRLNLDKVVTQIQLSMEQCLLPFGISADDASLENGLILDCSIVGRPEKNPPGESDLVNISARRMHCKTMSLRSTHVHGAIHLTDAQIVGELSLAGASVGKDQSGIGLDASRIRLGGDLYLCNASDGTPFEATGSIRVPGARIAGRLELAGASLGIDSQGMGLQANRLWLEGDFSASGDSPACHLVSSGCISLSNARIGGNLRLSGAKLGSGPTGVSFIGNRIQIQGNLLMSVTKSRRFDAAGTVNLAGGRVDGDLNLSGAKLDGGNEDRDTIVAYGLQVGGSLAMSTAGRPPQQCYRFTARCSIGLAGSKIGGDLDLSGAIIEGADDHGVSLNANRIEVNSDMIFLADICQKPFATGGSVDLAGANVQGRLYLTGAVLGSNKNDISLNGDRMKVGGGLLMSTEPDQRSTSSGCVTLVGARISSHVDLKGAQIDGSDQNGNSLIAYGIEVYGDVSLSTDPQGRRFTTVGGLDLAGAHVFGDIDCTGADLGANKRAVSFSGDRMQVDSRVFLNATASRSLSAKGSISVAGAHVKRDFELTGAVILGDADSESLTANGLRVDGNLDLVRKDLAEDANRPAVLTAGKINLSRSEIKGGLYLRPSDFTPAIESSVIVLDNASTGSLHIDLTTLAVVENGDDLRPGGKRAMRVSLSMEDLSYGNRPNESLGSVDKWISVLRHHTPNYQPRAYQQLAATHKAAGHERDATRILMAQQDHRRLATLKPRVRPTASKGELKSETYSEPQHRSRMALATNRAGLGLLKAITGYGYRPGRAIFPLLFLVIATCVLTVLVTHTDDGATGIPVARRPEIVTPLGVIPAAACSTGEAIGLAARIAVPLAAAVAQGNCAINTKTPVGSVYSTVALILQLLAWILALLFVAAVGTLIRRT